MDEATIKKLAKIYSLVAEIEELKSIIEAMKAENMARVK